MKSVAPCPPATEVERIAALPDPVLRNLQITQCYHELAACLPGRTGPGANWCTFATWASKQAGQTIRKEDLEFLLVHIPTLESYMYPNQIFRLNHLL